MSDRDVQWVAAGALVLFVSVGAVAFLTQQPWLGVGNLALAAITAAVWRAV